MKKRFAFLAVPFAAFALAQSGGPVPALSTNDADGDGLSDAWEAAHGLDPRSGMIPSMEGWWRFEADPVPDRSGAGNDLSLAAPATLSSDAPLGGAVVFDGAPAPSGVLDGLAVSSGPFGADEAFTAAAWFRADALSPRSPILSRTSDPDTWPDGFVLYLTEDGAPAASLGAYDAARQLVSPICVATGEWHHVALTGDGETAALYLDGTPVASAALAATASDGPFVVGPLAGTVLRPFVGAVADARLYSGALSPAEILSLLEPFLDSDGDGLDNLAEQAAGTDPHLADTDGDGLSDPDELARGTSPTNPDTDGDGVSDGAEVRVGRNPLRAGTVAPATPILHVWTPME